MEPSTRHRQDTCPQPCPLYQETEPNPTLTQGNYSRHWSQRVTPTQTPGKSTDGGSWDWELLYSLEHGRNALPRGSGLPAQPASPGISGEGGGYTFVPLHSLWPADIPSLIFPALFRCFAGAGDPSNQALARHWVTGRVRAVMSQQRGEAMKLRHGTASARERGLPCSSSRPAVCTRSHCTAGTSPPDWGRRRAPLSQRQERS